ncbi:MAG: class I SAM-dependent methyltransferase [Candidatus Diapherotrites archaeon]|nr:class I SAM-dependent methyltransferase [Candidatus Diapherotrites archaeon]
MIQPKPVDPAIYSEQYFTAMCDGFNSFERRELLERFKKALRLAGLQKGQRVLDLGCGRGELVHACNDQSSIAVGSDYAPPALKLAQKLKGAKNRVVQANARKLPFKSNSFDIVFFLETYEHLHDWEIRETLSEVRRVLKEGGRLIVSTSPNAWLAKPLYGVAGLFGIKRGINERVHVNEQSRESLHGTLTRNGFDARVELEYQPEWFEAALGGKGFKSLARVFIGVTKSRPIKFLATHTPAGLFLCTHVWARAVKK